MSRARHPVRAVSLALALAFAGPSAVHAQTGFTELTISDPDLRENDGTDFWVSSAAVADVDLDGDLDLVVAGLFETTGTPEAEERLTLYRNDGPSGAVWQFTPVPLDPASLTFADADLAFADYDLDGDPDLVVGADGATVLYRNDGGTLVPTPTTLPGYREYAFDFTTLDQHSLAWGDVDNDGDPDLLLPAILKPGGLGFEPSALLRNDGPGSGDAWTFTQVAALDTTWNAVSRWADMDLDGDLDLLHGNVSTIGEADGSFLTVYRNDNGALAPADTGFARLMYGTADWGDADNDGDLDVLVAGSDWGPLGDDGDHVRIHYRTPTGYTPVVVVQGGFDGDWDTFSAATWADYDGDGDVDLLIAGELWDDPGGSAQVYINSGGTFAPGALLPAPFLLFKGAGAFVWFDLDGDGDLDYLSAGSFSGDFGFEYGGHARLFRNDGGAQNAAPSAPGTLAVAPTADGADVTWSPATDDRTPAVALTYELSVTPVSAAAGVGRALPERGNVSGNTDWSLEGLPPGTYRVRVRALDAAYAAGAVAERTFTVGTLGTEPGGGDGPFTLSALAPNPASAGATLTLTLRQSGDAVVAVFDALGRRVTTLHDGPLPAGAHALALDVSALAPGVYVVRAAAAGAVLSRRLTVAE